MKIRTIRLAAYGPFTDATIDLDSGGSDFHLLFGPNEAGKSSTLRALRHMLFGIPARTTDNFLHRYPQLRIGARLVNSDGSEIEFVRRKGQAKTLRAADDISVLDETALIPFLGGINQEVFEQMFAIGHEDLIRGGEEIISGKGRIGEALFAAGAGLIRLQGVQQGLDEACGALFKPSGSTPAINQTIAALKAIRRDQKESLLLAKTWQTHDRSLRQAQLCMETVRQTLGKHKQRVARLQRIKDALPLIARKKEIDAQLVAFSDVPELPDDFGEKRRDAERDLGIATSDLRRSRDSIETIRRRIDPLSIPEALLQHASAIEALQHELGSFRKARQDRPGLEGRLRTLQTQGRQILAEIDVERPAESGKLLKLSPSTVGDIQDLGKTFERLTAKLESANARQRKLQNRLGRLAEQRKSLPAPADGTQLEAAVAAAQAAGSLDRQLTDLRHTVDALESELSRSLKRQALWRGPLEEVDTLPFPSKETIDRFDRQLDTEQRRIEKLREEKAQAQDEIARIQTELRAIDFAQEVPTESDLNDSRSLRDQGWGLIRQTLEDNPPSSSASEAFCHQLDGASDLPRAFEASMGRADRIADRLRREADQVSRKALLEARNKQIEAAIADFEKRLAVAIAGHREYETEWRRLWDPLGITPLSPAEMRTWLADMFHIRDKVSVLRADRTRTQILSIDLADLATHLSAALEAADAVREDGASLPGLIKAAQAHLKAQRALDARIASTDKELIDIRGEAAEVAADEADLKDALAGWRIDWEKNVRKIGLQADASPNAALAVIESIREVRNKFNEADILQRRMDGIDRDSAAFTDRVDRLVQTAAPDLKDEPQDRAAELLFARLTTARKEAAKLTNLTEQLDAAQKAHADADRRISQCRVSLDALCREAGCRCPEDLAETEKHAQRRQSLVQKREALDDQLRRLSAGATVEAFIDEAAMLDADSIDPELEALIDEIEQLEKDRSELDQTIGIEKAERSRMDGSAVAAGHAENAERLLAGLEWDVERYARLKIASVILARTVEQYRDKHQGPLITRASEFFACMTGLAFSRLRAEYDEKGNPILVGVRSPGGAQVKVDGMSDGTADQLYLALRLASLEQYLENNEPLPFIVDDILLRFDDDRALATLNVLAELSKKTQILFFTHHQHLVDLASKAKDLPPAFNVLTLGD